MSDRQAVEEHGQSAAVTDPSGGVNKTVAQRVPRTNLPVSEDEFFFIVGGYGRQITDLIEMNRRLSQKLWDARGQADESDPALYVETTENPHHLCPYRANVERLRRAFIDLRDTAESNGQHGMVNWINRVLEADGTDTIESLGTEKPDGTLRADEVMFARMFQYDDLPDDDIKAKVHLIVVRRSDRTMYVAHRGEQFRSGDGDDWWNQWRVAQPSNNLLNVNLLNLCRDCALQMTAISRPM